MSSAGEAARIAEELLDRRRLAQARGVLGAALARDPDDASLLLQSARADYLEDRYDSCRETLGRILQSAPLHFGARWLLLVVLTEQGLLVEAERLVLILLKEYPRSAELYAAYSRVMLRALLLRKARDLAAEALHLDPGNDSALRAIALCDVVDLRRGSDSQALHNLLSEQPDDQHTLALMVAALAQAGRHREALHGAQQLLRLQPDNPHWLNMTRELRIQTHWSMLPLWPLQRFGWSASIGLWVGCILLARLLGQVWPALAGPFTTAVLAYAIYSWVWPGLIRRWMSRN